MVATLALCLSLAGFAMAEEPAPDPPGRVAVVSISEGRVSLAPAGGDAWIEDVRNRPLGSGDRLWCDQNSRAELRVGSTAVRLGPQTGIEFLALDDARLQLRLSAGRLQLHVRRLDPGQSLELATPGGAVTVLRPGVYRLDVAENANDLRVEVLRGQAEVATQVRAYTLDAGQVGVYSGTGSGQTSSLLAPDDFDRWAATLDQRDDSSVSARYVAAEVPDASALDDYGDWSTLPAYGAVWLPRVGADFVPYRDGYWSWIAPWGWTWVDAAAWGFVPFHYGRWVSVGGRWGWCPGPIGPRPYYAPALVAWIGGHGWNEGYAGRATVGWFPLGWNEPYVPTYRASAGYVREMNLANTQLTRTYLNNNLGTENYRSGTWSSNAARYANQSVHGAVTLVARDAVTGAAPIAAAAHALSGIDLAHVPAQAAPPSLAPQARSAGARPATAVPNSALWTRPVLARTAPARAEAPAVRVVALQPRSVPPGGPPRLAASGGVARAYADRPPYATRPSGAAASANNAVPAQRSLADRPWTERPAGSSPPREAPTHPAPPAHRAPERAAAPQRTTRGGWHAALPRHYAAAYHPAPPRVAKHSQR